MPSDKMLTIAAVARYLGVDVHTVHKFIRAGVLRSFEPGPRMPQRVWESELLRFRSTNPKGR